MSLTATYVPSVTSLHPAVEGDGLLLAGYAPGWSLDKVGDKMSPYGLDSAVAKFMATNPVLCYVHSLTLPPIGKVIKAEIHRARGLWIEAIMPRPKDGTLAADIWEAARNGLLRALSLGGRFYRKDRGSHQEIHDMTLNEISLCTVAIEGNSFATSVKPQHVKCVAGGYVPIERYQEYKAITGELRGLELLAAGLAAEREQTQEMNELSYVVARARLGLRSR
jgi:hypothetical protein